MPAKILTCYCNAYHFPHRLGGGACHRDAYNRVDERANIASTLAGYDGWRYEEILARAVRNAEAVRLAASRN